MNDERLASGGGALERLLRIDRLSLGLGVPEVSPGAPVALTCGAWRLFAGVDETHEVNAGDEIAAFTLADGSTVRAVFDRQARRAQVPFDPAEAYHNYITEAWTALEPERGLSAAQLNAFYKMKRFLPRQVQLALRRSLARRTGIPTFPAWPFDRSVLRLLRFLVACTLQEAGRSELAFDWFWPGQHRAALILTHDVESADGLGRAVEIADLEEECGLRSSFNLGAWYDIDSGIVRELTGRGFEIGVHGLRHDRSMFASRRAFDSSLPELKRFAQRLGAVGFRSPATHRVADWLAELPMLYDCSVPHSDPFEPQPGGCCTLWPFFLGDVVELPYTLPQDHTLFTILRHEGPGLWLSQLDSIEQACGLVQCVTHPDRGYLGDSKKRHFYSELLLAIADRAGIWNPLPRDLATWWRSRDGGVAACEKGMLRVGDGIDDIEFTPPARVAAVSA